MASQRTDTRLLSRPEQRTIQELLSLPPVPLDAPTTSQPGTQPGGGNGSQQRDLLAEQLTSALVTHLLTLALRAKMAAQHESVEWKKKALRISPGKLEGACGAAKKVVDQLLAPWADNAARGEREMPALAATGDKPDLIDVTDEELRKKVGQPVSAWEMAKHFAANDPVCRKVMKKNHFNPYTGTDREKELLAEILRQFTKENHATLEECDRLGYWMANPDTGKIFVSCFVRGWGLDENEGAQAVRDFKRDVFLKLIHEYIHTLEHPLIPFVTSRNETIREGVCEYLTCKVIAELALKPIAEGCCAS